MAEFAGVAATLEIFGVPRWVSVPIVAFAVWLLVVKGNYRPVEKIFLVSCIVYLVYIVSAFVAKPDCGATCIRQSIGPRIESNSAYVADAHRPRRHDDRPLDAVLPAVARSSRRESGRRSTG